MQLSSTIGDFLISTFLVGHLYDAEKKRQHNNSAECYGKVCFQRAFTVVALLGFVSCIASAALYLRTRRRYREEFAP